MTAKVTNAGSVAGAVVPQLYLTLPKACKQPVYMLKGIEKVSHTKLGSANHHHPPPPPTTHHHQPPTTTHHHQPPTTNHHHHPPPPYHPTP